MATTTESPNPSGENIASLEEKHIQGDSLWMDAWRRLRKNRAAMMGFTIIILFILMAIFADVLAPRAYDDAVLELNNAAPEWVISLFPTMIAKGQDGGYITVSDEFVLGADELGRDLLSRIIYGSRISLAVAFVGPAIALIIGVTVGLISGFFGGRVDSVLMRFVDIVYAFPALMLIILILAYFRGGYSEQTPTPERYPHQLVVSGLESAQKTKLEITFDGKPIIKKKPNANGDGEILVSIPSIDIKEPGEYVLSLQGAKNPIAETTFTVAERDPADYEGIPESEIFATIISEGESGIITLAETETGIVTTLSQAQSLSFIQEISYSLAAVDRGMGGMLFIFVGIGMVSWIGMARLTRGQVLSVREKEYVIAAQSLGARNGKIMIRHVLPNILGPLIVAETLAIPGYISTEAFLSFIGLGVNRPIPSWGSLISDGSRAFQSYPYQAIFPAIALFLIMFAFNFLGDGLRDALDPRMRGVD
jgi:ABC-type dipeptide/oligopeptide/nickel transport system permease subunit